MNTNAGENTPRPSGDDLDPDISRFVREMSAAWSSHPDLSTVPPVEARRIADQVRAPWTRGGPEMAVVSERLLPVGDLPVRIRVYDPGPAGRKPGLVYLHGGGWTIFSLDSHDRVMREYAHRAAVAVVGVDYALSPESRYPVALAQVEAVVRHLAELGDELGIDAARIAVGGDSAGANLALATCLALRDRGVAARVVGMLLNYGVFDRWSSDEAHHRFGGPGYMLSSGDMEWFWSNYLRDDRDLQDPLVCPVNADLRGLPPALLVVPQCDLLAEQSLRMFEALRSAANDVELKLYPGASHSFLEAVSVSSLAESALAESAAWLRRTLATESQAARREHPGS